ncbi:sodium:solute symporter family protein [Aliikangiella coralliicola]|uniref:Na+:solute symporter n=1 Tax=Aliikangiella coralliicola TaxID=2592383 RepID=A0A545UHH8_9GAMM|nr:sodium:solute symporter family protein [Aliikangiella coralliicola]TQV88920.1 Na+:solute symporter [Aliikangiella coralliicola]
MTQDTIALDTFDYVIIFGFIGLIIGIGLYFTKRAKSTNDFFLGGRSLPWVLAGTSMVATTFAADTPLAVTELVKKGGIAGNWMWWNLLAGGMLTTFFFAKYWRRAGIMTDVELISIRYSGAEARFLRGFKAIYMGVFVNALIIGWVNLALMSLLQVFFGISAQEALFWTLGAMIIVFIYSGLSGLLGVVYTDFVQFIIAMTGSIVLAVMVVTSEKVGGIDGLKNALPAEALSFFPSFDNDAISTAGVLSVGVGSFLAFLILPWWNSWYPGAEPGGGGYVVQRMMSAKDEKNAVYANLYFQIAHYCIRPWPWILVALSCLILYPQLEETEARLGYVMAMKDFLPVGLKGLLLAAFFAAYMSTTASQLNWGASYIVNDFYRPFIKNDASEKQLVNTSRISVLIMILVAFGVTSQINSIAAVWNFLLQTGAGLGLVLILRWYWWRINAWTEIVGTIAPFIGYAIVTFGLAKYDDPSWGLPIIQNPKGFLFTIVFTIISWLVATFVTSPTDQQVLKAFYERIQPAGNWAPFQVKKNGNLAKLGLLWISAVVMAYSILFATGSLIFKNWSEMFVYLGVFLMSLFAVKFLANQVKVFE